MQKLLEKPLFWVDLELTGLDVSKEKIIEIACLLTDSSLREVVKGPEIVIKTEKQILDAMGEWCQKTVSDSHLNEWTSTGIRV